MSGLKSVFCVLSTEKYLSVTAYKKITAAYLDASYCQFMYY